MQGGHRVKRFKFVQYFNWRVLLLRVLVNAIALLITAAVVPTIYFENRSILTLVWMAIVLGVLNGVVKPVVQFLTLQFIFATYGVVVVLINAGLLWLLAALLPSQFVVEGLAWALLGGAVMGLLSSFLEALFGVTPPILPENYDLPARGRVQPTWALQPVPAGGVASGGASVTPAAAKEPASPLFSSEPSPSRVEAGPAAESPSDGMTPAPAPAGEAAPLVGASPSEIPADVDGREGMSEA
jgi:putative membrane protein